MSKSPEQRFKEKVKKVADGCHEWIAHTMPNGYGQFRFQGRAQYAHRVAWAMAYGDPGDAYVLHKCDNRKCVNPDHLFLGTFDDNMADMVEKGRQAAGSRNHHAKLMEKDVLAIRAMEGKQDDIARQFGVGQALVSMIRSRKIWTHI